MLKVEQLFWKISQYSEEVIRDGRKFRPRILLKQGSIADIYLGV